MNNTKGELRNIMNQFLVYFEDTAYIGIIVYITLATILLITLFVGAVLLCNPFLTEKYHTNQL